MKGINKYDQVSNYKRYKFFQKKLNEATSDKEKEFFEERLQYVQNMYIQYNILNGIKYNELSEDEKNFQINRKD